MIPLLFLLLIMVGIFMYMIAEPITLTAPPPERIVSPNDRFELWLKNTVAGPVEAQELFLMKQEGSVQSSTLVRRVGEEDWLPLHEFGELKRDLPRPKPAVPPAAAALTHSPAQHTSPGLGLAKAGGILLGLGVVLGLLLGVGVVEALVIAAGLILLVVGLCLK